MADAGDVIVTVRVTVSTGLGSVALSECRENLYCKSIRAGGRRYSDISKNFFSQLQSLPSIENLFVVVKNSKKTTMNSIALAKRL